jgi:hypothetical protein
MSFERRLFVPQPVADASEMADGIRSLCTRFGIKAGDDWSLKVRVDADSDSDNQIISGSLTPTFDALMAIASSPVDVKLVVGPIGLEGMSLFVSALSEMHNLKMLCFDDSGLNAFGDVGATSLGAALKGKMHLTDLQFPYPHGFGPSGARSLMSALSEVPHLRTLLVCQNAIGDVGATSLASALMGTTL